MPRSRPWERTLYYGVVLVKPVLLSACLRTAAPSRSTAGMELHYRCLSVMSVTRAARPSPPKAAEDPSPRVGLAQLRVAAALAVDRNAASVLAHFGRAADASRRAEPTSGSHLRGTGQSFRIGRHSLASIVASRRPRHGTPRKRDDGSHDTTTRENDPVLIPKRT